MKRETSEIVVHPEVMAAANRLKEAYKVLKYAQTSEKQKSAHNDVIGELFLASIVTKLIEHVKERD